MSETGKRITFRVASSNTQTSVLFFDDFRSIKWEFAPNDDPILLLDNNLPRKTQLELSRSFVANCDGLGVQHIENPKKNVRTLTRIWSIFSETRPSVVVIAGGGTLHDVAGFAASTFNRGIRIQFIPTTLLAIADVAIGGKTSIDFANAKNAVGAEHPSEMVYCVRATLQTLEPRSIKSTYSEMLKFAILSGGRGLDLIKRCVSNDDHLDNVWEAACWAVKSKSRLVSDASTRQYGLFGHLVAHSIEGIKAINHGEAVGIGLRVETQIAFQLGLLNVKDHQWIMKCITDICGDVSLPTIVSLPTLLQRVRKQKNFRSGRLTIHLPKSSSIRHRIQLISYSLAIDAFAKLLDAIYQDSR